MKASTEIPAALLPNEAEFSDPFFKRFALRHAPEPVKLTDSVSKNYFFPTFYRDVTCAIGIFLCDYEKARAILPHPRMRPVRMPRGRAIVTFSCYEYKQVMNVAPYNEVAMTIPTLFDARLDLPVLPLLLGDAYPGFGYYVFGMPVTSLENQLRGNRIWGLPKVTQEIETREDAGDFVTTAYEAPGKPYFDLRVPMGGKAKVFDVAADLYSTLAGKLFASRTCFRGSFNVTKHMNALFAAPSKPDRPYLTIGAGPGAATLRSLGIEERPFQFRFARQMNAAFDLPRKELKS